MSKGISIFLKLSSNSEVVFCQIKLVSIEFKITLLLSRLEHLVITIGGHTTKALITELSGLVTWFDLLKLEKALVALGKIRVGLVVLVALSTFGVV